MSEPCTQAENIQEVRKELSEVVKALQVVAVQKKEIEHLIEHQRGHRKWLLEHEKRIQDLERQPSQSANKWYWMAIASLVGILSSVATKVLAAVFVGG